MAHVTGTDLQDLQFDALTTDTGSNPQMPASGLASVNKQMKTTSKKVVGAINELKAGLDATNASFVAFTNSNNSTIGDAKANIQLVTDLNLYAASLLEAATATQKTLHGDDLANPDNMPAGQSVITVLKSMSSLASGAEPAVVSGTVHQVYLGDKTWGQVNTDDTIEGSLNLFYTNARVSAYLASVVDQVGGPATIQVGGQLDPAVIPTAPIPSNVATLDSNSTLTPSQIPDSVVLKDGTGRIADSVLPTDVALLDAQGKLLVTELPAQVVQVDGTGTIPQSLLPASSLALDAQGRIPEAALPTTAALLDAQGKLLLSELPASVVQTDAGGHIPDALLAADVVKTTAGVIPTSVLPASVVQVDGTGKIPDALLAADVVLLDATGHVPMSVIPAGIAGGLSYQGAWDASTNTPAVPTAIPANNGWFYKVSIAGSHLGTDYRPGDWIISDGTQWDRINNTETVTNVFGRIGAIAALEADYAAFYPALSGSYSNPSWITGLAASKITGIVPSANLGTGTADATTYLRGDGTWATISQNAGSVTSVGLAAPSEFSVSSSPVTGAGTLTLTWATQTANKFFGSPDGSTGAPGFRALAAADVPALDAAKITTGTLATSLIPALDASKITTGTIDAARLGTGTPDGTKYLRDDGTWATVSQASGSVTSVGLAAPAEFSVSGSPVTASGSLTFAWAAQTAGLVLSGPVTGSSTPGFRLLAATDIPALDAVKIATGVFVSAQIPSLDAAKITTGTLAATRLGSGTADATTYLRGDGTWATVAQSGGTVTSVGLTAPSQFTVSGSPVTTAGSISFAWATQTAGKVLAGPATGTASPDFRVLVATDIPAIDASQTTTGIFAPGRLGSGLPTASTYLRGDGTWAAAPATGTVTSVDLAMPAELSVSSSPITSSGTIAVTWASQTANKFFGSPDGAAGVPGFRALLASDVPSLDAAKIATGVFAVARLGSGSATASTYLRGDGTWASVIQSGGTVTSVGLAAPAEFNVTGSPVTADGSLTFSWASQSAGYVLSGPIGASGIPGFRALVATDIPALDAAKIATGVFTAAQIPSLNASKIADGVLSVSVLGTGTADITTYLRGDGTWAPVSQASGTVTSVGLVAPAEFSVVGSPVTAAGALTLSWVNQPSGKVFAAPSAGTGKPGFRTLLAGDIPGLDASKIVTGTFNPSVLGSGSADSTTVLYGNGTWSPIQASISSVGLSMPAIFTNDTPTITSSGTFGVTLNAQPANTFLTGPSTGAADVPTFRAIDYQDVKPAIQAMPFTDLATGLPSATTFLRGDGTWGSPQYPESLGIVTGASTIPVFARCTLSANVSISAATWTQLVFNTVGNDTMSFYSTSTGKFTPKLAGFYSFTVGWSSTDAAALQVAVYKNGTVVSLNQSASTATSVEHKDIVYLNGSTDYVTFYAYSSSAVSAVYNSGNTFFAAYQLVQPATATTATAVSPLAIRLSMARSSVVSAGTWAQVFPSIFAFSNPLSTCWASGTGRFRPTVAGYYTVSATIGFSVQAPQIGVALALNNVQYNKVTALADSSVSLNDRLYFNGTTDYVTIFVYSSTANTVNSDISTYVSIMQESQPAQGGYTQDYIKLSYVLASGSTSNIVSGFATRTFNTKDADTASICSLNTTNSQFTLQPGTYRVRADLNANSTSGFAHYGLLYNVTTSSITLLGEQTYTSTESSSPVVGTFSIATAQTFEFRTWSSASVTSGQGPQRINGVYPCVITTAELWRDPTTSPKSAVVCRTRLATAQVVSPGTWTTIAFDTVEDDTQGWWDTSLKRYAPLKSGYYQLSAGAATTSGSIDIAILKNDVIVWSTTGTTAVTGSYSVALNGTTDYVSVQVKTASGTSVTSAAYPVYFSANLTSAVVTQTPLQAVTAIRVHNNGVALAGNSNAAIIWSTVEFDALGEFNVTTGKFSPKTAGYYLVTFSGLSPATSTTLATFIYKNGLLYAQNGSYNPSTPPHPVVTSVIYLTPSDIIETRTSMSATTTMNGEKSCTYLSICSVLGQQPAQSSGGNTGNQTVPTITAVRAHRNAVNFTVVANADTLLPLTTAEFDEQSEFSVGTSRFYPKQAGKYNVTLQARHPTGVFGTLKAMLFKNGVAYAVDVQQSATANVTATVSTVISLTTKDYIEPWVNSTATSISGTSSDTFMSVSSVNNGTGISVPSGMLWPSVTALRVTLGTKDLAISTGSLVKVVFSAIELDANSEFSIAQSRWSPKQAGYYSIVFCSSIPSPGSIGSYVYMNGSGVFGNTYGSGYSSIASSVIYVTPNDYIEAYVRSTIGALGAAESTSGARATCLSIYSVNSVALNNGGGGGGGGGSVGSVGLSMPAQFVVSGSPVSSSGMLTADWAPARANAVLVGPASGANAAPTMRALVAKDISQVGFASSASYLRGDMTWAQGNTTVIRTHNNGVDLTVSSGVWTKLVLTFVEIDAGAEWVPAPTSGFTPKVAGYFSVTVASNGNQVSVYKNSTEYARGTDAITTTIYLAIGDYFYGYVNSASGAVSGLAVNTYMAVSSIAGAQQPTSTMVAPTYRGVSAYTVCQTSVARTVVSTYWYGLKFDTTTADTQNAIVRTVGTYPSGIAANLGKTSADIVYDGKLIPDYFAPKIAGVYHIKASIAGADYCYVSLLMGSTLDNPVVNYQELERQGPSYYAAEASITVFLNGTTDCIFAAGRSSAGTVISSARFSAFFVSVDQQAAIDNAVTASATLAQDQTVVSGIATKVALDTIDFDSGYSATAIKKSVDVTAHKISPVRAGYYTVCGYIATSTASQVVSVYVNGSVYRRGAPGLSSSTTFVVYLNGTTDYVELYATVSGTTVVASNGLERTSLQTTLVTGALAFNPSALAGTNDVTSSTYTQPLATGVTRCDATNQAITVNLPGPSLGTTPYSEEQHVIKKIDASANTITVNGNSFLIDGQASVVLNTQYQTLRIRYNGVSWDII